mmetsp:Transcript_60006/g.107030  ORF Transcript_60006/g.107030 Transcript_60006/m.107030 type:complete len:223 (-) Transcript_60006:19-687(-)
MDPSLLALTSYPRHRRSSSRMSCRVRSRLLLASAGNFIRSSAPAWTEVATRHTRPRGQAKVAFFMQVRIKVCRMVVAACCLARCCRWTGSCNGSGGQSASVCTATSHEPNGLSGVCSFLADGLVGEPHADCFLCALFAGLEGLGNPLLPGELRGTVSGAGATRSRLAAVPLPREGRGPAPLAAGEGSGAVGGEPASASTTSIWGAPGGAPGTAWITVPDGPP